MMMLAIATLLIGAVLGQRFKIVILVPAMAIASIAVLALGIASHSTLGSELICATVTITALQLGYLGGIVIRVVIEGTRIGGPSSGIAAAQRSVR